MFHTRERMYLTHRLAFALAKGPIPAGALVRHTCDNPACCAPEHLELGSSAENAADRVERGRASHAGGADAAGYGLDEATVREIRLLLAKGIGTRREIAGVYGLTYRAIMDIANRRTWQHVE